MPKIQSPVHIGLFFLHSVNAAANSTQTICHSGKFVLKHGEAQIRPNAQRTTPKWFNQTAQLFIKP